MESEINSQSSIQPPESRPLPGREYTPDLNIVQGRYRLRFALTWDDLEAVQRLRYQVFNLELGEGLSSSVKEERDEDPFDLQCQHLMVIEDSTERVIGTYRLQVSEAAAAGEGFYSDQEFDLSRLPEEVRNDSVELGRACILREHREKRVLFMLWSGLASYILWNKKRYFFGCSSLTSQDANEGLSAYFQLQDGGHVWKEFAVPPRAGWECELEAQPLRSVHVKIPPLFAIYLRYGAKVCGPPAIDREFKTIDFLTLLDLHNVDEQTLESFTKAGR